MRLTNNEHFTAKENFEMALTESRNMTKRNIQIALNQRGSMHSWAVRALEQALKEKTMSTPASPSAVAKAAKLGSGKKNTPKTSTKKSTEPKGPREASPEMKYSQIAKMYTDGKTASEIAEKLDLVSDNKDWPNQIVLGRIKALKKGVVVNGQTIKIEARGRVPKEKPAKEKAA